MIVDDLHLFGTHIGPPEYDPPLIVDADRVLTHQIALERFKAVSRRRVQGLEKGGGVHHDQFSASYPGEICRKALRDHAALKDRLGKLPLEAPDHGVTYLIEIRISTALYLDKILREYVTLCAVSVTVSWISQRVPCTLPQEAELEADACDSTLIHILENDLDSVHLTLDSKSGLILCNTIFSLTPAFDSH
jgi:hypothetical protein